MMNAHETHGSDRRDPLTVYLRDHYAGSAAGLALVQRCRRANAGTALDDVLAGTESDIIDDRHSLQEIMSRLGVSPSVVKTAVGRVSEVIGRLKSNGRIMTRSPSSTVVELEGLAAGITTKANLWRSLRATAVHHPGLDAGELHRLVQRATDQLERVIAAHDEAAEHAFASASGRATSRI
jgi:hypothetical protein